MIRQLQLDSHPLYVNDDLTVHRLFVDNGLNYEWHIRDQLRKLLPTAKVFWDIGANVGIHTVSAKIINPEISVVCFEPSAPNLDCLYRTIWENRWHNVTVLPVAVSSENGLAGINGCPDNPCVFVLGPDFPNLVPTITLDSLALPFPDVVKIDIEGCELLAFQGAKRLLNAAPVIVSEFNVPNLQRHYDPASYIDFLLAHEYSIQFIDTHTGALTSVNSGHDAVKYVSNNNSIGDFLATPPQFEFDQ